jgi:uncharacterized iron-regulated membrane protein
MKLTVLNRSVHSWGSIIITIPLLVIIVTGIILLLKKDINWIQPATTKSAVIAIPLVSFQQIFNSVKSVKKANINQWSDINKIDISPDKGIIKVIARNNFEIQLDAQTGKVLQVAFRRSDIIEQLHDGSFFNKSLKYIITLPSGIILLVLLITGVILFFQPYWVKAQRKIKTSRKLRSPSQEKVIYKK